MFLNPSYHNNVPTVSVMSHVYSMYIFIMWIDSVHTLTYHDKLSSVMFDFLILDTNFLPV